MKISEIDIIIMMYAILRYKISHVRNTVCNTNHSGNIKIFVNYAVK